MVRSLALVAGLVCASQAWGVILQNGATVATGGTSLALRPELSTNNFDSGVVAFETHDFSISLGANTNYHATFEESVILNDDRTFSFEHRIVNTFVTFGNAPATAGTSIPAIISVELENFSFAGGLLSFTDVDFRTDSPGTVGSSSAGKNAAGDLIIFNYGNGISPSQESKTSFIRTDASSFGSTGFVVISLSNHAFATIQNTFRPDTVPAPTSAALLGLGGLVIARRRR